MQDTFKLDVAAVAQFDMAVLRFDPDGVCTYANAAAEKLVGMPASAGLTLDLLFPDEVERAAVWLQLRKRMTGQASSYATQFKRPLTHEPVQVSVFAFPDIDDDGEVTGSVVVVRDLREEHVDRAMHEAIETLRSDKEILAAVAALLRRLVPFDDFRVLAISKRREHLRRVFSTDDRAEQHYPFKWWPIPPFVLKTLDTETARTIDINAHFKEPAYARMLKEDPAAQAFVESGVRYSLSIPIVLGDRVVAFVALDTRQDKPYSDADLALCERLPLAEAVKMALHYEEEARLRACVDLIRELGQPSSDLRHVANILVKRLACHFGWDHVAVFQHDEDSAGFRVLSQASANGHALKPDFVLPEGHGAVARAYAEQREVNLHDVRLSAKDARAYVRGVPGMISELAIPVPGDTRRWVLNVESRLVTAFADEEIETLRLLVAEAGHILERAALLEMRSAILCSINDGVIETNRRGVIRRCNPAACRMLGRSETELLGQGLDSVIHDPLVVAALGSTEAFSSRQIELTSQDGHITQVLLSGAPLPENLGGRVFVASDVSYELEVQRIGSLKDVFRHASLESRVPLALAASWLDDLARQHPDTAPTIERVLKQLRKADLPLERLLRLATPDVSSRKLGPPIDLNTVLGEVLAQVPDIEREGIVVTPSARPALVDVAAADLRFCLESVLSFAMRTKPQDKRIGIRVSANARTTSVALVGDWKPDLGTESAPEIRRRWRRQTVSDLVLAKDVIQHVMEQVEGQFRCLFDECLMLELSLPTSNKG